MRDQVTTTGCTCPHHDAAEPYDSHDPDCPAKMQSALSAAVGALGDVMLEMQRRKLLSQQQTTKARALLSAKSMTDEQVGNLAAKAFEAGAMALAKVGHPGATTFTCSAADIGDDG